jgi:hypothetical protein
VDLPSVLVMALSLADPPVIGHAQLTPFVLTQVTTWTDTGEQTRRCLTSNVVPIRHHERIVHVDLRRWIDRWLQDDRLALRIRAACLLPDDPGYIAHFLVYRRERKGAAALRLEDNQLVSLTPDQLAELDAKAATPPTDLPTLTRGRGM